MADYYIKCIFENDEGNITRVGYGPKADKNVEGTKSKEKVISEINPPSAKTVNTAYYSESQEEWLEGDEIHSVEGEYIRTDRNEIKADNLENLGTCPSDIVY